MRIGIDARLQSGSSGGVEQVILGLLHGLSMSSPLEYKYFLLTLPGHDAWLTPIIQSDPRFELVPYGTASRPRAFGFAPKIKKAINRVSPQLREVWRQLPTVTTHQNAIPMSNGVIERLKLDLMHFTIQSAFITKVPSIYQPHDLQFMHYPKHFRRRDLPSMQQRYRAFCDQAAVVAIMTEWGRSDLVEQFGLPAEKIQVVPWGPITSIYPRTPEFKKQEVRQRYNLPDRFLLFPAQTWPHKNHVGLARAIKEIRSRSGISVPIVCCGQKNGHFGRIAKEIDGLGVGDCFRFLGFIPSSDVSALYDIASGLVFPSLFEGWGMPVVEAFERDLPVACSRSAALPEVACSAALLFDASDPSSMAQAIQRLWSDSALRTDLIARGRSRSKNFSWEQSAAEFVQIYDQIGRGQDTPMQVPALRRSLRDREGEGR